MKRNFKIFIVEDDITTALVMKSHLRKDKMNEVEVFMDAASLKKNIHKSPDLVTVDYHLPDANGAECMAAIHKYDDKIPVVCVSGQSDINTAVEMVKNGAWDYLVKDENLKESLLAVVKRVKERLNMQMRITYLEKEVSKKYQSRELIKGNSPKMEQVFALIEKASNSNISVSVTGDTGTGKELVAKSIHHNSSRSKHPFIAINVAAIPSELIESELFGAERGAYTGAEARRIGKFEQANGGTLFLDEIGDMDLAMQAKLLRVLQENEFSRLGSNETIELDVRLIIATHKNLVEAVRDKSFREDLYFRLLGMPIALPPLRERGNDILLLAKFFIAEFCDKNGLKQKELMESAVAKLLRYYFPGNVRELKALMELAVVMSNDDTIEAENVTFLSPPKQFNLFTEELSLHEYELKIIKHFMDKFEGNVRQVAEQLDIGKTTVYRLIKEMEE